jgi:branched-chain amino acid transport system substrate-binding protein
MTPSRLLFLLLLTIPLYGQTKKPPTDLPIGGFGTLSGPVRSFGINSRAALNAANEEIDRMGGVKLADGTIGHFRITYADDQCSADVALGVLKEFAASDDLVAIGPTCSAVAEFLFHHLQAHVGDRSDAGIQMPIFTDGATKADLAGISEWAFRDTPNERSMYQSLWRYVRKEHPELHTVYVGEEADFAHSHSTLQNIIRVEAEQLGFAVQGGTKWSIHDTEFSAPANDIAAANADVVVISAHALTTCGMLKELQRRRFHPKLLVGLTSASTPETLTLCGPAAEGLLIPTTFIASTPETQRDASLVEKHGGIADLHSMAAWEILFALKQAIEAGKVLPAADAVARNREIIRRQLSQLTTMPGLMGTIPRTPDRESLKPFVLVQVKSGKWQVVSDSGLSGQTK